MNKFAKKLALFLALALTLTLVQVTPVVNAASKITLKSGAAAPASVYAGHSYTLKVAGTAVKFYSSNKKVATIGATTGKFKPVAPGSVKITAKNKKTGKAVATKTFKVLQRATSVAADQTEVYLGKVGDTATIKATKTPATSTDVVKFFSADKTIASVGMTSGKVTAKKEGKTTISVYAMATKATSKASKYNKVATVNVYVGAVLDTVAQVSTTEIKATFKTDVSDKTFLPADFAVTKDETGLAEAVKEVKVSGKEVTLTMYNAIKDGKAYTVKYGENSAQFTATEGKVAALEIIPAQIAIQTETEIKVVEKDANGIILGSFLQSELATLAPNVELEFNVTDGYVNGDKVYFNTLTSKAVAKATYHTYEYQNGQEVGAITTGDVTITATAQAAVTADGVSYSISQKPVDFAAKDYKQNTAFPADKTDYAVYFKMVDSNKKEITDAEYAKYTLTTSNNLVFMVDEKLTVDTNDKYAKLVAVNEGTANILVKNAAGTVVATLPVTVGKSVVPTTLTFDKATVTLSNSTKLSDEFGKQTVKATVKDQYGNELTTGELKVEARTKVAAPATAPELTQDGNSFTFAGAGATAGTYLYTVSYAVNGTDYLKTTYRVVIQNLDDKKAETYAPIIDATTVENTVSEAKDAGKKVTVALGHYYGGVLADVIDVDGTNLVMTVVDSNNKALDAAWINNGTIIVTTEGSPVSKIPAGTYKITLKYTFDGTKVSNFTTSLTVTDKQPTAVFAQKKVSVAAITVPEIVKEAFGFSYNGKDYTDYEVNEGKGKTVTVVSGKTIVFKTIVVNVTLADKTVVEIPVTVNKSVTTSVELTPATTEAPAVTQEAPAVSEPTVSEPAVSEPTVSEP